MVIEDNRTSQITTFFHQPSPELLKRVVHPIDRLAAFLVDVAVLFLIGSVAIAPIQRKIKMAQIVNLHEKMVLWILLMILILGLITTIYHFVAVSIWGQTLGKKIFGIKVVDVWSGKKPAWTDALTRAVVWWLECMCGGIAFLGVYSDPYRRPLHDRISNTMALSTRGRYSRTPEKSERFFAQAIFLTFYVIGFAFVFQITKRTLVMIESEEGLSWMAMLSPVQCDEVSDAIRSWPMEHGELPNRISVALALFAAGGVDEACLNREAFQTLQSNDNHELAYLARAFVTSERGDMSDHYLEKVCDEKKDSESCFLSHVISYWSEQRWSRATQEFQSLVRDASVFVKIWAVKHFEKTKTYAQELKIIDGLWPLPGLSSYLQAHRAMALWGQGSKNEARLTAKLSIESSDKDAAVGLASWFCYTELGRQCAGAQPETCRWLEDRRAVESRMIKTDLAALAIVRQNECYSKFDAENLKQSLVDDSQIEFVDAVGLAHTGKLSDAYKKFERLYKKAEAGQAFSFELAKRIIQISQNKSEVQKVLNNWKNADPIESWNWQELGRVLFDKLVLLRMGEESREVAQQILENHPCVEDRNWVASWLGTHGGIQRLPASEKYERESQ